MNKIIISKIIILFMVFISLNISGCGGLLQSYTEINSGIDKDTVWDKKQSPYLLRGDITVQANRTLTIEPGVVVTFSGNNKLIVEGTLRAEGTSANPIIFRQSGKYYITGWYGIVFKNKNVKDVSVLKYGNIYQARFAIYCDGGSPQISYCTITGNNAGVHLWNSNAIISNNTITDNIEHGLYIGSLNPTITNNLITRNVRGIICDYAPNPNIQQNDIFSNSEYDFYVNRSENDIQATNNWWGTTNETAIRQKIFDKQKNGEVGNVYINPISQHPFNQ